MNRRLSRIVIFRRGFESYPFILRDTGENEAINGFRKRILVEYIDIHLCCFAVGFAYALLPGKMCNVFDLTNTVCLNRAPLLVLHTMMFPRFRHRSTNKNS